ncbi:uncharacterized protein LOC132295805 [Cornus florida]|uniref:uncharacterized protein LOC132295805 n=1 Tax=Cornus florida TaxID=4283 RepID=UPI0028A20507|nr:uncharacterized protein LOC132295805 [Cornus florida]
MMWLDYRLPNGPLLNQINFNDGEILQLDLRVKIDRLISLNHWVVPDSLARIPFFQSLNFHTKLNELPNPSTNADTVLWLPSPSCNFSLAHTIKYLLLPTFIFPWHKTIWFKHHIPKHSFIAWLTTKGRLYTLDRKPMKHKHHANACFLSLANNESLDHLFFRCEFSKVVWSFIQHTIGLYIQPSSWKELILWCFAHWSANDFLVHKLLLSAAFYFLWMERNNRAFRKTSSSPTSVISQIKKCLKGRLALIKLKNASNMRNVRRLKDLQKLFLDGCSYACAQALTVP